MHRGKKHRPTRKNKSHKMRGGKGFPPNFESVPNSNGPSAWYDVSSKVGPLDQQYNRTFLGNGPGNELVVGGQRASMAGGRRRRRSKHRRGGSVVSDAIVPLGLLALQQTYGKKFKKSRRTRRTRRTRRR